MDRAVINEIMLQHEIMVKNFHYRVSHKYLTAFKMWAWHLNKSSHTYISMVLSILMAKFSENLVAIALTISLSMAFLCHMIKGIGGHE